VRPGSTLTPQPEIPAATRMVSAPADTASLIFLEYCVFILILPLLRSREQHYVRLGGYCSFAFTKCQFFGWVVSALSRYYSLIGDNIPA
jgi:hypothetical protein